MRVASYLSALLVLLAVCRKLREREGGRKRGRKGGGRESDRERGRERERREGGKGENRFCILLSTAWGASYIDSAFEHTCNQPFVSIRQHTSAYVSVYVMLCVSRRRYAIRLSLRLRSASLSMPHTHTHTHTY
jgi:hypothetical protein